MYICIQKTKLKILTFKIYIMETLIFISESEKQSLEIMKKCLKNKISFEFLNGNEFYFNIYDDDDFQYKRKYLGEEIISEKNKVN